MRFAEPEPYVSGLDLIYHARQIEIDKAALSALSIVREQPNKAPALFCAHSAFQYGKSAAEVKPAVRTVSKGGV